MTLQQLNQQKLREIRRINEFYNQKKKFYKEATKMIDNFTFDIVCDVRVENQGIRYSKRKAIFIHQLKKYFIVKPR